METVKYCMQVMTAVRVCASLVNHSNRQNTCHAKTCHVFCTHCTSRNTYSDTVVSLFPAFPFSHPLPYRSLLPRSLPPLSPPSAGIGRTGVFIGADIGMYQLESEGEVDLLKIVSTMRQDRGGMVQTENQYIFLHQVCCMYSGTLKY